MHANRYLENEGIEYLRTYLHLPSEIVPSTLKRATRTEPARARPSAPARADTSKTGEDRSAYRRAPGGGAGLDKKGDVGAGAGEVEFVSIHDDFPKQGKTHKKCHVDIDVDDLNAFLTQSVIWFFFSLQRGGFGRGSRPQ